MTYSKGNGLQEFKSILEICVYYFKVVPLIYGDSLLNKKYNQPKNTPIILFPGFLHTDKSLNSLKYILEKNGYIVYGGEQGRNGGFTNKLKHDILQKVREIRKLHNQKVVLIGGSLGGIYAREIAKELPELIKAVITLGTPIYIDKNNCTNIYFLYDFFNKKNRILEKELKKISETPLVRTLAISSKSDGIVNFDYCYDKECENRIVKTSHFGFRYSKEVSDEIIKFIEKKE